MDNIVLRVEDAEVDDENPVQLSRCNIDAVGVYQQQQPLAAAEDDRGRPSELRDDGRLRGRKQPTLPLSPALAPSGSDTR